MDRTVEKILSIISMIVNVLTLGIVFIVFIMFQIGLMSTPDAYESEEDMILYIFGFVIWIFIVAIIGSIVLTIIGLIKLKNDEKKSGKMFLFAFLLAGLTTVPGLLLLLAGIMCLVRESSVPKVEESPILGETYGENY